MIGNLPRVHVITAGAPDALTQELQAIAGLPNTDRMAVHARGRALGGRRLFHIAREIRDRLPRVRVWVNDRADVTVAVRADGLHLPEAGLPTHLARTLVGPDCWIGRSVHSVPDARAALAKGADYVVLGPIWPTGSHPGVAGLGLGALEALAGQPIVAIGGITPTRAAECRAAGAYGVAAISAVWHAADPASVVQAMLLSLEE